MKLPKYDTWQIRWHQLNENCKGNQMKKVVTSLIPSWGSGYERKTWGCQFVTCGRAMTSAEWKFQRKSDIKGSDIINSKLRFRLRKEKYKTTRVWHVAKRVQSDLTNFTKRFQLRKKNRRIKALYKMMTSARVTLQRKTEVFGDDVTFSWQRFRLRIKALYKMMMSVGVTLQRYPKAFGDDITLSWQRFWQNNPAAISGNHVNR